MRKDSDKNNLKLLIRAKLLANTKEEVAELFHYPAFIKHNGLNRLPESTLEKWIEIARREVTSDGLNYFVQRDLNPFCEAYSIASEHYERIRSDKWNDNSVRTNRFLKSKEGFDQVLNYSYVNGAFPDSGVKDEKIASELQWEKSRGVKQFYTVCLLMMFAGLLYPESSKVKSDPDYGSTFIAARERLLEFIKNNGASTFIASICGKLFYDDDYKTRFKLFILFSYILDCLSIQKHPWLEDILANPACHPIDPPLPDISYWREDGEPLDKAYYYVINKTSDSWRITRWRHGNMKNMQLTCFHDGSCTINDLEEGAIRGIIDNRIEYEDSYVQSISFDGHNEDCKRIVFSPIEYCEKIDIESLVKIDKEDFPDIESFEILDKVLPKEDLGRELLYRGELLFISREGLLFSGPGNRKFLLRTYDYPELEYIGIKHLGDCSLVEYRGRLYYYFKHMVMLIPVKEEEMVG